MYMYICVYIYTNNYLFDAIMASPSLQMMYPVLLSKE